MRTKYMVIIEKGERGTFGAYSPDLPGCAVVGDTVEETERLMDEAIEMYLEECEKDGIPPPVSTTVATYFTSVGSAR